MKREICVVNRKGLHGRPATIFAEIARRHPEDVTVSYGKKTVSGKSLITLMSLAVPRNGDVVVTIEGAGAETVLDELERALGVNYD
jgi:phosphotransferase system HPr (HPr) family protein